MHLHFHHPSAGKLYNMLKRADPIKTDPSFKNTLEEISKACNNCSEYYFSTFRFRATIPPDELVFNMELAIDLMWLSGRPVMHIIDTHTLYQTGEFVKYKSAADLWDTVIRCWAKILIGYPNNIRIYYETAFDSEEFRRTAIEAGVALQFSGVELHNSLGVGERYHSTLRRVYNKVQEDHIRITEETALRMAIKVSDDTAGPTGLVPTLYVFGSMPALFKTNTLTHYRRNA